MGSISGSPLILFRTVIAFTVLYKLCDETQMSLYKELRLWICLPVLTISFGRSWRDSTSSPNPLIGKLFSPDVGLYLNEASVFQAINAMSPDTASRSCPTKALDRVFIVPIAIVTTPSTLLFRSSESEVTVWDQHSSARSRNVHVSRTIEIRSTLAILSST